MPPPDRANPPTATPRPSNSPPATASQPPSQPQTTGNLALVAGITGLSLLLVSDVARHIDMPLLPELIPSWARGTVIVAIVALVVAKLIATVVADSRERADEDRRYTSAGHQHLLHAIGQLHTGLSVMDRQLGVHAGWAQRVDQRIDRLPDGAELQRLANEVQRLESVVLALVERDLNTVSKDLIDRLESVRETVTQLRHPPPAEESLSRAWRLGQEWGRREVLRELRNGTLEPPGC